MNDLNHSTPLNKAEFLTGKLKNLIRTIGKIEVLDPQEKENLIKSLTLLEDYNVLFVFIGMFLMPYFDEEKREFDYEKFKEAAGNKKQWKTNPQFSQMIQIPLDEEGMRKMEDVTYTEDMHKLFKAYFTMFCDVFTSTMG